MDDEHFSLKTPVRQLIFHEAWQVSSGQMKITDDDPDQSIRIFATQTRNEVRRVFVAFIQPDFALALIQIDRHHRYAIFSREFEDRSVIVPVKSEVVPVLNIEQKLRFVQFTLHVTIENLLLIRKHQFRRQNNLSLADYLLQQVEIRHLRLPQSVIVPAIDDVALLDMRQKLRERRNRLEFQKIPPVLAVVFLQAGRQSSDILL